MSIAQRIGQEAQNGAENGSQGLCMKYVRQAIQRGFKQHVGPVNVPDPNSAGPYLKGKGFVVVDTNQYRNGDIAVFHGNQSHPQGHIQVYYQGRWYSDFKQKNFSPYANNTPTHSIYRLNK